MAKPFETEQDGGTPASPPAKPYTESLEGSAPTSGAGGGESKGTKYFKDSTAPRSRKRGKGEPR